MLQRQEFTIYPFFERFIRQEESGKIDGTASESRARGLAPRGILSTEESTEENPSTESTEESTDHELEDAARTERDYLRQRLGQELGREPTEQELDEWLRQHTEGY